MSCRFFCILYVFRHSGFQAAQGVEHRKHHNAYVREYRRRCRVVQEAVLEERMNEAVILTFRGAYTDIGAPDFADRLTEAISRATEIPRDEFE